MRVTPHISCCIHDANCVKNNCLHLRPEISEGLQINFGTEFSCITNIKIEILWQPILLNLDTLVKGKRGYEFTAPELESLAGTVEDIVPIRTTEWECVWNHHNDCYMELSKTAEGLKHKFQEMAR